jgi:hypothetical protein
MCKEWIKQTILLVTKFVPGQTRYIIKFTRYHLIRYEVFNCIAEAYSLGRFAFALRAQNCAHRSVDYNPGSILLLFLVKKKYKIKIPVLLCECKTA